METFYRLRAYAFLFGLLTAAALTAQTDEAPVSGAEEQAFLQPNVPPQRVRTMSEWEEIEGIAIAWDDTYEDILTEIVRYSVDECLVYIITNDNSGTNIHLLLAGVDTENVRYLTTGFNSVWIRDYGPWTVYLDKVATRGISDYLYNRPNRDLDDQIPYQVADYLSTPIYNADENPYQWTHSGGNFLRDGVRTAYSSDLVLRENSGKTGREIAEYADLFFGIEDYRILSRLDYDTIHHLDMHMRTLDEETIAIGEYPPGVADGPVIEANLHWLRNHYRTPYGNTYRILRLPMPPAGGQYPPLGDYRTYTNSVFVNKTILVPIYAAPTDSLALRLYEDYFPGYRVVGIDCNDIIDELGALHCITKLVGVEEPLLIEHPRLRDVYENENAYPVEARLYHASGITQASVYYRIDATAAYQEIPLQPDPDDADRWTALIPAQAAGTEIQYYIEAFAQNGKRQVRPLPAPAGYYHFSVKPWQQPPVADWVQTNHEIAAGTEILFTDDSRHGITSSLWSFPGGDPVYAFGPEAKVTYEHAGQYAVRLVVDNPLGTDTLLRLPSVRVRETYPPFSESFTTQEESPWEVVDPDENDSVHWQWRAAGGCAGACLEVPHRQAPAKLNREFLRTAIDLRGYDLPRLAFQVAYAQRNAQHFDELRINLIDQTGTHLNIYNKGGDLLATQPDYVPDFIPTDCADWRTESVDLSEWAGQRFLLEFESIGDRGNSIFLDEINLTANALPQATITFPADNTLYIGTGAPIQQTMRVEASDSDGTITQVDFFLGNTYLGSTSEELYEMPFTLPGWGDYSLQARATDDRGSLVWTESVNLRYDYSNSLNTLGNLPVRAGISPTPATEATALLLESDLYLNNLQATLYTATGARLTQWQMDVPTGGSRHPIALAGYPAGTYFLHLRHGFEQLTLRVVKL